MAIGGLALNTLKKLKGARLGLPSASIVLAKAMGRGQLRPTKGRETCLFQVLWGRYFA
jgi:hypothetical protein